MKQVKAMNIYGLPSGFARKSVAASVALHVLIGLMFFTSPLIKEGANREVISVTFHQAAALSDQGGTAVPVAAVRKENTKPVRHRQIPENRDQVAVQEQRADLEEKKDVVLSRSNAIQNHAVVKDVKQAPADTGESIGNSVSASANHAGSKDGQEPQKLTGQTGDARFGERGAPSFIHREMPVYPALALRLGKEGRVLLKLLIDADGQLKNVEVIEAAGFGFTEASLEAVKRSTYEPGFRNGVKVAMRVLLPVSFRLQ